MRAPFRIVASPAAAGLMVLCSALLLGAQYFRPNGSTIIVTDTNDNGPGTLRQALVDAQDGDTIQFDPALIGQTITLTTGELLIDKNITISGPGWKLLTVSAIDIPKFRFRVFHVNPGHNVTIAGLTISDGHANGAAGGAGIFNDHSALTINNCAIRNNHSERPGGGIYSDGSGGSASLTIINSTVGGNSVMPLGGTGSGPPVGGGIANNATDGSASVTIDNCVVTNNVARAYWSSQIYVGNGGGIFNDGANAILTVSNSVVSNNIAGMSVGDVPGHEGAINNPHPTTIVDATAKKNRSFGPPLMTADAGSGGGIDNGSGGTLTINNTTLSGNSATFGAGALNGHANITNSTITGNQALIGGVGGGILGDPTITNSTISDNEAVFGGGIYGSPTVTNSTISGNRSISSSSGGGGIYGGGVIRHSTISGNTGSPGGGILATGPLEIGDTLLKTGATGANIAINGGTVTSHGYNISNDDGTGVLTGPGDQINTDPLIGPLQDNGGPTATHALLTGSLAINTGDPNFTPPPEFDQRGPGYPRVFDGRIDIGAFELQQGVPTPTPTATATAPTPGPATHFTIETPPDVIQFVPFTFSVTARDQFGKVAIGYAGTVHFTSTDTGKGTQLPNDSTLTHGTGTFSAILTTPDYQTITATDTVTSSITGTSSQILVFENQPSPTPTPTPTSSPTATPPPTAQLANISTRLWVQTGFNVGISGFIINGAGPLEVVLRSLGPSLPLGGTPTLPDTYLQIYGDGSTSLLENDDWQDDPAQAAQLMKLGLAPTNPLESAIVITLQPGAYTAITTGKHGDSGVGLAEVYNVDHSVPLAAIEMANISTRGLIQTGDNVMIGGFILTGSSNTSIAIRGIGPSLTDFGVPNALPDPTLELRDQNGGLLIANDNWQDDANSAGQLIAHGLALPHPNESGIFVELQPGLYTAILGGKNNGTGVGLVEAYNVH